jgi:hypothetical protein
MRAASRPLFVCFSRLTSSSHKKKKNEDAQNGSERRAASGGVLQIVCARQSVFARLRPSASAVENAISFIKIFEARSLITRCLLVLNANVRCERATMKLHARLRTVRAREHNSSIPADIRVPSTCEWHLQVPWLGFPAAGKSEWVRLAL